MRPAKYLRTALAASSSSIAAALSRPPPGHHRPLRAPCVAAADRDGVCGDPGLGLAALVDYSRRYHLGQPVSTSRAEGCVDEIANARMVKRQRMRWSPRGAHRVAVVRAAVLDARLGAISHDQVAA